MFRGLASVREVARKDKKVRFTVLLHYSSVDWLRENSYTLKRKAAPGVDGVAWQEYEPDLQEHIAATRYYMSQGGIDAFGVIGS